MTAPMNRHELGQRLTKDDLAIWLKLARRGKNLAKLWRETQRRLWAHPLNYRYWGF